MFITTIFTSWLLAIITVALATRKSNSKRSRVPMRTNTNDTFKLTIEDMFSPNNNLSLLTKTDVSYFVLVTNKAINKEEFVFADNLTNLKNKVVRLLRNYAALEANKTEKITL